MPESPIYLDTAATALKPQVVLDALTDFYAHRYGTVHRGVYDLSIEASQEYQEARIAVQNFLGAAHSQEIVFTKGTTEAINLVAHSFVSSQIQPHEQILISRAEHHANFVPWQQIAQQKGAKLTILPLNEDHTVDLEALEHALQHPTRIVALFHVSNVLGSIQPIREIADLVHRHGSHLLVDGAQAPSHLRIDVQALDADFYTFSGHKLYGPTGIGVLYAKHHLLERMPPYQFGGDMIQEVRPERTTFNTPPTKFEAGTPPIAQAIGLQHAIAFLQSLCPHQVTNHMQSLYQAARQGLASSPHVQLLSTPPSSHLLTFTMDRLHPLDIATMLNLEHIYIRSGHLCCQPLMQHLNIPGACRMSFGLYNSLEEIQVCLEKIHHLHATLDPF